MDAFKIVVWGARVTIAGILGVTGIAMIGHGLSPVRSQMPVAPSESYTEAPDMRDPYIRCTLAMDAAELPSELCLPVRADRITEDSPAWNCEIHGNRVCGRETP
jgi:hypothetical protein